MNREEDFLEPVIRHVRWERAEDIRRALAGEIHWPTAVVTLSHFRETRADVDRVVRDVQTRLNGIPFIVTGLVPDRSVPVATPDDRGQVEVYARNGVQRIEVATRAADGGGLHTEVVSGLAVLRAVIRPLALDGWRESYQHDLTSQAIVGSRWWDYRQPVDGAPAP